MIYMKTYIHEKKKIYIYNPGKHTIQDRRCLWRQGDKSLVLKQFLDWVVDSQVVALL